MLPIFGDYRKMLADYGVDLSQYKENKLWIDRLIIKGFDKRGKERKILRLHIDDKLEYSHKWYENPPDDAELDTFEELYERNIFLIESKERESIQIIENSIHKYPECELFCLNSMGKDSKLVEHLLKKVTTNYRTIFYNTTCDCADVYKEMKRRDNIEVVTPVDKTGKKRSLYNMARQYGFATRHHRWCCSIFKEGAIKDYLSGKKNIVEFMGMRREESTTRSNYEMEKEDERFDDTWHIILPILNWTEFELWLYTMHNDIPINPKYKKGYSRCGCHILCPFYTKSTWILDKYWYPYQYERFHSLLVDDFKKRELWPAMNCTQEEYHFCWNGGKIRDCPTDEVVKEFMEHKGLESRDIAQQYFDKRCMACNRRVYKNEDIAMNLKFNGRDTNTFLCKTCFLKKNSMTKQEWNEMIDVFKQDGCVLF